MTKLACELEKECVLPLDLLKMKFESYQVPIDRGLLNFTQYRTK